MPVGVCPKILFPASFIHLLLFILSIMKNHRLWWTILIVMFLCFACSDNHKKQVNTQDRPVKNTYATGFEMSATENAYRIRVTRPWQQATDESFTYLLSRTQQEGTIHIPVQKVVCMSTTHVAYLEALDELASVAGLTSTGFVFSNAAQKRIKSGKIQDVGFSENLNLEKIISLNPDVVFAYVIQPSEMRPLMQLKDVGIPVVLVGDYLEQTPLAKMEWLRFFAGFYDKIPQAGRMIDSIATRYDSLKQIVPPKKDHPKVLTNVPWQGVWWVPGGESYMAQLIKDAGGDYIFSDRAGTESHAVDIELVYQRAKDADVWVHTGNANSYEEVFNADRRLKSFHELSGLRIYNNNRRQSGRGNDFFESAVMYPDRVLAELMQVFYPEAEITDSFKYYKSLEQ
jgi:iron complex transport system substrate-binding protein